MPCGCSSDDDDSVGPDLAAFMYLNPEDCYVNNVSSVEQVAAYLLADGGLRGRPADMALLPDGFDPEVYIASGGLELDVSALEAVVRPQSRREGLTASQVEHNARFADNLIQEVERVPPPDNGGCCGCDDDGDDCGEDEVVDDGGADFRYSRLMTPGNVREGDVVRMMLDEAEPWVGRVAALDYDARTLRVVPEGPRWGVAPHALPLAARYRLTGVRVSDVRRIAAVNYCRATEEENARRKERFDPEFNMQLYRLLYPDARLLSRDAAYVDYLGRQNTQDYRAGKEGDLLLNREGFIWPTLVVNGLDVRGGSVFHAPVYFANGFDIGSFQSFGDGALVVRPDSVLATVPTTIAADLHAESNVCVTRDVRVGRKLCVSDDARFGGDASFAGDVTMAGDLDVAGDVTIGGETTFGDDVLINSNLTVLGRSEFHLDVDALSDLAVAGDAAVQGGLAVAGDTALQGTLDVVGDATLRDLLVLGPSLTVPVGGDADRPAPPRVGDVRFNADDGGFEGFHATGVWASLGGTRDADGDTYVSAELEPGSDDNNVRVATAGVERARFDPDGRFLFDAAGLPGALEPLPPGWAAHAAVLRGSALLEDVTVEGPALRVPVGGDADRPAAPEAGQVRFNTDDGGFEGFHATGVWASLGGTRDADGDTYVSAELEPGSDDNNVRVATAGVERARFDPDGRFLFDADGLPGALEPLPPGWAAHDAVLRGSSLLEDVTVEGPALRVPVGGDADRPVAPETGQVRFNTDDGGFEGYHATGVWASLGGTRDADGDTYVSAETEPGADDDNVRVATAGVERARFDSDGRFLFDAAGLAEFMPPTWAAHSVVLRGSALLEEVTVEGPALRVPVGGDADRPAAPEAGQVRFNTDDGGFEGYHATGVWASLGGTRDADGDTYVSAELEPGSDDNNVRVATAGVERARFDPAGRFLFDADGLPGALEPLPPGWAAHAAVLRGSSLLEDVTVEGPGLRVPVGGDDDRPASPETGQVRFNADDGGFEGYHATGVWASLGGTRDADGDTFVSAETEPGADDDRVRVATAGVERARFDAAGRFLFDAAGLPGALESPPPAWAAHTAVLRGSALLENVTVEGPGLRVPVGEISERPAAPETGQVRFNATCGAFEGFHDSGAWAPLGGVRDADGDTYVSAEVVPGADDDAVRVVTADVERARFDSGGRFLFHAAGLPAPWAEPSGWGAHAAVLRGSSLLQDVTVEGPGLRVPVGGDDDRPASPETGQVRFNTDGSRFEGFNARAGAWVTLGGVRDADGDTFVTAELEPGEDDDRVRVVTAGVERASFDSDGRFLFDAAGLPGAMEPLPADWAAHAAVLRGSSLLEDVTVEGPGLRVPVGGDDDRPASPETGQVRFNTDASRFEGYNAAAGAWTTLGGVRDADGDTFVSAETEPGADDDNVRVATAGVERARFDSDGRFLFDAAGLPDDTPAAWAAHEAVLRGSSLLEDVRVEGPGLRVPVGGDADRPTAPETGQVRFNTDGSRFEGYNAAAGAWTTLGGVRDADGDTFVSAETEPGADDDRVRVVTAGTERARFDAGGRFLFDAAGLPDDTPPAWAAHAAVLRGSSLLEDVTVEGPALRVPVGGDADRPAAPETGQVRFNTDASRFEGYNAATGAWSTLGGVRDVDGDTFVEAETAPGDDDDRVRVVTAGVERVRVGADGRVVIGDDGGDGGGGDDGGDGDGGDGDGGGDGSDRLLRVAGGAWVDGPLGVGEHADVGGALSAVQRVLADEDAPLIASNTVTSSVTDWEVEVEATVQESGDFSFFAVAFLSDLELRFASAEDLKRVYRRHRLEGLDGGWHRQEVAHEPGTLERQLSGIVLRHAYAQSAAGPPSQMTNVTEYDVYLMVQDRMGRKTATGTGPYPPSESGPATRVTTLNQNPLRLFRSRVVTDGAALTVTHRRRDPLPPGLGPTPDFETYVFALSGPAAAGLEDEDEALAFATGADAGVVHIPNADGYDVSETTLTQHRAREGPGEYGAAAADMANYALYHAYILLHDNTDFRNLALIALPAARTADELPPAVASAPAPTADFASSGAHELVVSVAGVEDDTPVTAAFWATEGAASAFASAAAAAAFLAGSDDAGEHAEPVPLEEAGSAGARLGGRFSSGGAWAGPLQERTEYTAHVLLSDEAGNLTYVSHEGARTLDVTPPSASASAPPRAEQTWSSGAAAGTDPPAVRVRGSIRDGGSDFAAHLFLFAGGPGAAPGAAVLRERMLRAGDGAWRAAAASSPTLPAGADRAVDLRATVALDPEADPPQEVQFAHGMRVTPVLLALDAAARTDLAVPGGNAAALPATHVPAEDPPEAAAPSLVLDLQPPSLAYFEFTQGVAADTGHPVLRAALSVTDRHPARAWAFVTTREADLAFVSLAGMKGDVAWPWDMGWADPGEGPMRASQEVTQYSGLLDAGGARVPVEWGEHVREGTQYWVRLGCEDHHGNGALLGPWSLTVQDLDPTIASVAFDVASNRADEHPNCMTVAVTARDRGRGGVAAVYLYYTTATGLTLSAEQVAAEAEALDAAGAEDGDGEGGRVWEEWAVGGGDEAVTPEHITPRLPDTVGLELHVAVRDGEGNYGRAPVLDLNSAATGHGGLTYDTRPPEVTSLSVVRADQGTACEVAYGASDAGGSELAVLYVYYESVEADGAPADYSAAEVQQRAVESDEAGDRGPWSGGYEVSLSNAGAVASGTLTTPALAQWTRFAVHAVAEDKDGNLSAPAVAEATAAALAEAWAPAAFSAEHAGDGNSVAALLRFDLEALAELRPARTRDLVVPVAEPLAVQVLLDNTASVAYDCRDPAPAVGAASGVAAVYVFYELLDAAPAEGRDAGQVRRLATLGADGAGGMGELLGGAVVRPAGAPTEAAGTLATPALRGGVPFRFYCAAEDAAGNVSAAPAPTDPGATLDTSVPAVELGEGAVTLVEPAAGEPFRRYTVSVSAEVTAGGGAPLEAMYVMMSINPTPVPRSVVKAAALAARSQAASLGGLQDTATATVDGDTLQPLGIHYAHVAAYHRDTQALIDADPDQHDVVASVAAESLTAPQLHAPIMTAGADAREGLASRTFLALLRVPPPLSLRAADGSREFVSRFVNLNPDRYTDVGFLAFSPRDFAVRPAGGTDSYMLILFGQPPNWDPWVLSATTRAGAQDLSVDPLTAWRMRHPPEPEAGGAQLSDAALQAAEAALADAGYRLFPE